MITADILMWFLLIVGLLIVFNSYWLAAVALFPGMVERARHAYSTPFKSLLLGLITAVPIIAAGIRIASTKHPGIKLIGLTIAALPILIGLLGSGGLSQRIGNGMASPLDAAQPWRRVLRGGVVLSLAFLLPFIGWFGVLPLTLVSGFGAALRSLKKDSSESGPNAPASSLDQPTEIPVAQPKEGLA